MHSFHYLTCPKTLFYVQQQSVDSQARGASGAAGVAVNNTRREAKRPAVALMNGPLSHVSQDETGAGAASAAVSATNGPVNAAANEMVRYRYCVYNSLQLDMRL